MGAVRVTMGGMDPSQLALALGSSLTAGINLYLTILTLGVLDRFEMIALPASLEVLAHPLVLGAAGLLFLVEFVADKIPYVDNTWDAVHSFIRVPAGAVLAASSFADVPNHLIWAAALLGGAVTMTAHGAKASTRLAINSTPEPFTNWFVSLVEDGLSVFLLVLVAQHPYLALVVSLILLAGFAALLFLFYRFIRYLFRFGRQREASA